MNQQQITDVHPATTHLLQLEIHLPLSILMALLIWSTITTLVSLVLWPQQALHKIYTHRNTMLATSVNYNHLRKIQVHHLYLGKYTKEM